MSDIKEWEQNTGKVKEFGEVFTPDSIVISMIQLVDEQLKTKTFDEYISTTYLEPACGDGQFLIRLLSQKMLAIPTNATAGEKELLLVKALCSIYGVDIQKNNVDKAIKRMYAVATGEEVSTFDLNDKTNTIKINIGIAYSDKLKELISWILNKNVIQGDTLDTNNALLLTGYEFNGNNVSICECPINDLSLELNKHSVGHYMNLINDNNTSDNSDDDFDF